MTTEPRKTLKLELDESQQQALLNALTFYLENCKNRPLDIEFDEDGDIICFLANLLS